jgi:hypothetical protein
MMVQPFRKIGVLSLSKDAYVWRDLRLAGALRQAQRAWLELRIDLGQSRLVETAAALRVGASRYGQLGNTIFGELAFGLSAGRAAVVGDDQAHAAYAIVRQELAESDGGGRMDSQLRAALDAGIGRVRGLGQANRAVAQLGLLSTASRL